LILVYKAILGDGNFKTLDALNIGATGYDKLF
jgi:hypothetical protein